MIKINDALIINKDFIERVEISEKFFEIYMKTSFHQKDRVRLERSEDNDKVIWSLLGDRQISEKEHKKK